MVPQNEIPNGWLKPFDTELRYSGAQRDLCEHSRKHL